MRLTPGASREAILGPVEARGEGAAEAGAALGIKVRARPVEGAANAALRALLAAVFAVPRSSVVIDAGDTSRLKGVTVRGDPALLLERSRRLLSARSDEAR